MGAFPIDVDDPLAKGIFCTQVEVMWGLTPIQATLLYHTLRGVTAGQEQADTMFIQLGTVMDHRSSILVKLGFSERERGDKDHWPTIVRRFWRQYIVAQKLAYGAALGNH